VKRYADCRLMAQMACAQYRVDRSIRAYAMTLSPAFHARIQAVTTAHWQSPFSSRRHLVHATIIRIMLSVATLLRHNIGRLRRIVIRYRRLSLIFATLR